MPGSSAPAWPCSACCTCSSTAPSSAWPCAPPHFIRKSSSSWACGSARRACSVSTRRAAFSPVELSGILIRRRGRIHQAVYDFSPSPEQERVVARVRQLMDELVYPNEGQSVPHRGLPLELLKQLQA